MGLPRAFVGFSSTDIHFYRLMQAWKYHEHIDFSFIDCQLSNEIRSDNEAYIKSVVRQRIGMCGTYVMLIGEDTRYKHKYVRWEAEVAIEKKAVIIGVNLNKHRSLDFGRCPAVIRDVGALFVPFSPRIIAYALEKYVPRSPNGAYHYRDHIYRKLGYDF